MTDWIKCSDQLPEEDKTVIVACYWTDVIPLPDMTVTIRPDIKDGYIVLRITLGSISSECGDKLWYEEDGFPMVVAPTYWMPIPEAPKIKRSELK